MRYFVCFCYRDMNGRTDLGNTDIVVDDKVTTYDDIRKMERKLEEELGIEHLVILNYKPLESSVLTYQLSISVDTKLLGKGVENVAENIEKLLSDQVK